jgi:SEC-C motif-containing protein
MKCHCGSSKEFEDCCKSYLDRKVLAPTAEALMRARYTAHVLVNLDFIESTVALEKRKEFDRADVKKWAADSEWMGLEVLKAQNDVVEFVAKFKKDGKIVEHHEVSKFRKDSKSGEWFFVDGEAHAHQEGQGHHHSEPIAPVVRETPKIGRNDPCSCGSGKKFKKCCGA